MDALLCASTLTRALLDGPRRRLVVVDRAPAAWQLADETSRVVGCLVTTDAILLPHALLVDVLPSDPTRLSVGDGAFWVGDVCYRPGRWWSPARPTLAGRQVPRAAVAELAAHWSYELGLGPGLTPHADDVLCGALVVLAATRTGEDLRAMIAASALERRTTAASAALIRLACAGWCIPQVADFLRDVASGVEPSTSRVRLLEVGGTSGQGLLAGISTMLPPHGSGLAA